MCHAVCEEGDWAWLLVATEMMGRKSTTVLCVQKDEEALHTHQR